MYSLDTKFLIVDDNVNMRGSIVEILQNNGFDNLVQAQDGQAAINILESCFENLKPVDFVISDWNMPGMTGIDLLKFCRKSEKFKTLPFLMVTGERAEHLIIDAARSGVTDYLIKPVSAEKIKRKIEKVYQKINGLKKSA